MPRSTLALFVLLLLFMSRPALSHDKWFEIEPSRSTVPTQTKIYLVTGEALQRAELLPLRRAASVYRFQRITTTGVRDLRGMLREDMQPIGVVSVDQIHAGTSLIVLDTQPVDIWLTAEKFQSYLFEERLIDILAMRAQRRQEDAPGRERYSRCLKTIVQVGDKRDDVVLLPVGQDLEIVPLTHPYSLRLGANLAVRVLFRGKPISGRAVTFARRHHSHVTTTVVRTDDGGQASVPVDQSGDWLVALVHMEPATEAGADWRSYWSSLTFALSPEPVR